MAHGVTANSPDRTARLAIQAVRPNRPGPSKTRARILETAAQFYRRIGHRKTTVADIAKDMSMSPANVYRFFPSKHAIESTVAGVLLDEVVRAAGEAARRDGSAAERLRAVLQTLERLHAARWVHDRRLHELVVTAIGQNWSVTSAYAHRLSSVVAEVISEGQARGEFSGGDPMMIARCVLGATSGYLDPLAVTSGTSSSRPTLDQMTDFCIGALGAVSETTTIPIPPRKPKDTGEPPGSPKQPRADNLSGPNPAPAHRSSCRE
jgi:AcrR family transcriptional regulator